MYVSKHKLREEVIKSQKKKELTDELVTVVEMMVDGILSKYKFQLINNDDARQNALLVAIDKIHRIDPEQNIFSYLTTCILNSLRSDYRHEKQHNKLINKVINRMGGDVIVDLYAEDEKAER